MKMSYKDQNKENKHNNQLQLCFQTNQMLTHKKNTLTEVNKELENLTARKKVLDKDIIVLQETLSKDLLKLYEMKK